MKLSKHFFLAFLFLLGISCSGGGTSSTPYTQSNIISHEDTSISAIPLDAIEQARNTLHIAYGHTSHGSQLITGMAGLDGFMGGHGIYIWNAGGTGGALDLRDNPFSGASDLGNPDRTAWAGATRTYLDANPACNVIMWSWCGQVSDATVSDIDTYLTLMSALESDYPDVTFVYMTGHLDGSGESGNLQARNEQIREFCLSNGKILYDFADIESYDPDGAGYLGMAANDNCDYDSDGNGTRDSNWAIEWQNENPGAWYDCSPAHTQPLNGNLKAYAAWHLFAVIAGWDQSI